MNPKRFDPERNKAEIRALYGEAHADRTPEWDIILGRVGSVDNRDLRDPEKIGRRIINKVKRRKAA